VTEAFESSPAANSYIPKPSSSVSTGVYLEPQRVELTSTESGISIRYTTDGTMPGLGSSIYRDPIRVDSPLTVMSVAVDRKGISQVTRSDITVVRGIRSINLVTEPSPKYSALGALTLIDGARGSEKFRDGRWIGFEGDDLEVVFDFGAARSLDSVSVGCLNDTTSWIFLPATAEVFASSDGREFRPLKQAFSDLMKLRNSVHDGQTFTVGLEDFSDRYLKVVVKNMGICPPGHSGEGEKAWLFVDEVIVR
jgi:hexosaminidase